MKLMIKDTRIRHGEVDIGRGDDSLVFERCIFVGGTVNVGPEVDRKIFVNCLFQGTRFTAQSLSPRIATGCHWQAPNTEEACQDAKRGRERRRCAANAGRSQPIVSFLLSTS